MTGNKPTFIAYTVRERSKGKSPRWTDIGAAWPSNPGFTIQLEALPIGNRIVLVEPEAEPEIS